MKGKVAHENRKKLGFTSTELEMKEPFKKHYNIDMFQKTQEIIYDT